MKTKKKIKRITKMLQILNVRYDYIMAKDNPYYRIFGKPSERLMDAAWNLKVQKRLKTRKTDLLCK
jgi:hypothetical protein